MPSLDVTLIAPPATCTSSSDAARLVLPAAVLRPSAPGKKQKFVRCIVKVVKRAKSEHLEEKAAKRIKTDSEEEEENQRQPVINSPIMISRTNLKQQLMREQMQQMEKRERELSSSVPTQSSNAIRVPLYASPVNVHVPKQVLMVKSKLENPTPYHVRESQQRQVREYLSQSHHGGRASSLPTSPPRLINSVEPSPSSDFSAAVSSTTASPELDEFWQDFQNFNSCSDSVADNILDPSLTATVVPAEADLLEVLSMLPAFDNVSSSCPAGIPTEETEVLSEEKIRAFQKDRQKKDNHNRIEKRRRFNINDRIKELGALLPRSTDPYYDLVKDLRQNKGTILKASVAYVQCLKNEVQKIPDLENRCRRAESLNKKLLLRIQSLELQLKANNIPVNNSTWLPSTEEDINAIIKQEVLPSPPLSNSSLSDQHYIDSLQRLPTVHEQYDEYQTSIENSTMQLPHSAPPSRKRLPIMQFLTVKKESQSQASSCSQSPATCCASPAPSFSPFDELMMEDDQPVTGDPMFSSRDSFSPENMDFMS